jgi:hypothetical protein
MVTEITRDTFDERDYARFCRKPGSSQHTLGSAGSDSAGKLEVGAP